MHYSALCFMAGLALSSLAVAHPSAPVSISKEVALKELLKPVEGQGQLLDQIRKLRTLLVGRPDDPKLIEKLGRFHIAQARFSLNESGYSLAEICGQLLETLDAKNPAGLLLRGHCLLAMHQFHEAEDVARRLLTIRQEMQDHALLGDAFMEQGHLDEALPVYQAMIDAKPCLPSYSRVAHVRWLKGDLDGAVEMAEQAIACGSYRDPEPMAWVTTRLAFYQWQRGDLAAALHTAERAEELLPGYAHALFLRGRVLLAKGEFQAAIPCLRQAVAKLDLPEVQWALADALKLAGDSEQEAKTLQMVDHRRDGRSFALMAATRRVLVQEALDLAKAELRVRQDVFSWDALAWAQFAAGETKAALISVRKALAEGTRDARISLHAGIIAHAAGDHALAITQMAQVKAMRLQLLPSEQALLDQSLTAAAN